MLKKNTKSAVKPPPSFGYRRVDTKNSGLQRQKSASKAKRRTPLKKYRLLSKKKRKQADSDDDEGWQELSQENSNEDDALVYRKLFDPIISTQGIQTSPFKSLSFQSQVIEASPVKYVKPPKVLQISFEQAYSFKPSHKKEIAVGIASKTSKQLKKWNHKKKILKRAIHTIKSKYYNSLRKGIRANIQAQRTQRQLRSSQKKYESLLNQNQALKSSLQRSTHDFQQRYLTLNESQIRANVFVDELRSQVRRQTAYIEQLEAYYTANESKYKQQMKIIQNKLSQVQLEKLQIISNKQISFSALRQQVNIVQQELVRLNQLYSDALLDYQSSQQVTIRQYNKLTDQQEQIQQSLNYIQQQKAHIETLQAYNTQLQQRYDQLQNEVIQFQGKAQAQQVNALNQNARLKQQLQRLKQEYQRQYNQYIRQKAMYTRALQSGTKRNQIKQRQNQSIRKKYAGKQRQYSTVSSQLQQERAYINQLKTNMQASLQEKDLEYYRLQQEHLSYRFQAQESLQMITAQKKQRQKAFQALSSELVMKQLQFRQQKAEMQAQISQKDTQLMQRAAVLQIKHSSQKDLIYAMLNKQKAQLFAQGQLQKQILHQHIGALQYNIFTQNGQVQRLLRQKTDLMRQLNDLQNRIHKQPMQRQLSMQISSQYGVYHHLPALKVSIQSQTQRNVSFIKQVYQITEQIKLQSKKQFKSTQIMLQKRNKEIEQFNKRLQKRIFSLQQQIDSLILQKTTLQNSQYASSAAIKYLKEQLSNLQAKTAQQILLIKEDHQQQRKTLMLKVRQLTDKLAQQNYISQKQVQIQTSNKKQAVAALQSQESQSAMDSELQQSQLTQINDQDFKALRMGDGDKVQMHIGRQLLTLKPYQGKFWWGLSIRKPDGRQYYTHQAVQFNDLFMIDQVNRSYQLHRDSKQNNERIVLSADIMMIMDEYKGDRYVGIRHYNYYGGEKQPTRYGFNVLYSEFGNFLRLCSRFLV